MSVEWQSVETRAGDGYALYKFVADSADGDRDFETLSGEQFYAASYASLNDRFDAPRHFTQPEFLQRLPNETSRGLAKRLLQELDGLGVYCLSGTKDSAVMWAHYANLWKGFCIEYSHHDRRRFLDELRRVHGPMVFQGALSINYVKSLTRVTAAEFAYPGKSRELILRLLGQKTDEWNYEKEYRLLFKNPGRYHMPPSIISGVYLGHAMSNPQKERYVALLSGKGIPVWEARADEVRLQGIQTRRLG